MTAAKWSWQELRPGGQALLGARSSHAVSVVGDTVYVFGGEHQARTTIDSRLLALDIYNSEVTYTLVIVAVEKIGKQEMWRN